MIQKRFLLIIKFFRAEKQNIRVRSWSRPFFLEHESRIFSLEPEAALGLGRQEPEPPKKVEAPQHWIPYN